MKFCLALLGVLIMSMADVAFAADMPATVVYAQVVNGFGRSDKTDEKTAASWIVQEVKALGSENAAEHTEWVLLTVDEKTIYTSARGGRLISAKAVPKDDGTINVTVSGYKIDKKRYDVTLDRARGSKRVIKLTHYSGGRNVYIALHVGKPE